MPAGQRGSGTGIPKSRMAAMRPGRAASGAGHSPRTRVGLAVTGGAGCRAALSHGLDVWLSVISQLRLLGPWPRESSHSSPRHRPPSPCSIGGSTCCAQPHSTSSPTTITATIIPTIPTTMDDWTATALRGPMPPCAAYLGADYDAILEDMWQSDPVLRYASPMAPTMGLPLPRPSGQGSKELPPPPAGGNAQWTVLPSLLNPATRTARGVARVPLFVAPWSSLYRGDAQRSTGDTLGLYYEIHGHGPVRICLIMGLNMSHTAWLLQGMFMHPSTDSWTDFLQLSSSCATLRHTQCLSLTTAAGVTQKPPADGTRTSILFPFSQISDQEAARLSKLRI